MEEKFELNEWTPPVLCEEHTPSRTGAANSAPKQARSGKENIKKTAKKRKQESGGKNEPKRRKAKGIYASSLAYVCTTTTMVLTFHVELIQRPTLFYSFSYT